MHFTSLLISFLLSVRDFTYYLRLRDFLNAIRIICQLEFTTFSIGIKLSNLLEWHVCMCALRKHIWYLTMRSFFLLILTSLFLLWKVYCKFSLEKNKQIMNTLCLWRDTFSVPMRKLNYFKDNSSWSNLYEIRLTMLPFWLIIIIMTNHNFKSRSFLLIIGAEFSKWHFLSTVYIMYFLGEAWFQHTWSISLSQIITN